MRLQRMLPCLALAVSACAVSTPAPDTGASPPSYDVWEARVGGSPDSVFRVALSVLADSGFVAKRADAAERIIATHLTRRNVGSDSHDYRLDVHVMPVGRDSARIRLRGEWCHVYDGTETCYIRTAWSDDWVLVRGIGTAIVRAVR